MNSTPAMMLKNNDAAPKDPYKRTLYASYLDYVVQGIVNNVNPILLIYYQRLLGLPLTKISVLIAVNFAVQIATDLLSSRYVGKVGIRKCMLLANGISALGLIGIAVFPMLCANAYPALLAATVLNAVGGGLIEVLVSPIVEAIPGKHKDKRMSMLHSFYSWGCAMFIAISTLLLKFLGAERWYMVPALWALVPIADMILFFHAPICRTPEEKGKASIGALLKNRMFWAACLLMVCAGAGEMAMSQWASYFSEVGLGVDKTLGDLLGPGCFAVLMGLSRVIYGKSGGKVRLERVMKNSALLCLASYLLAAFAPHPLLGLAGCALCGLACGIFWPGTYSIAAKRFATADAAFFAILAFFGDVGCFSGPQMVSLSSGIFPGVGLKAGLCAAAVFPLGSFLLLQFGLKKEKIKEPKQKKTGAD